MSPFEIKATFVPKISITCWSADLMSNLEVKRGTSGIIAEGLRNAGQLSVILGITDNWDDGQLMSSSGAKLYIRGSEIATRNYALARAAALLNEEDFDQAKYLEVFYGKKWWNWGMPATPSGGMLQRTEAHKEIGLDKQWSSKPFVEQIQLLQKAYKTCLDLDIPAGSYKRSILQVACSQVAKNALEQEVAQVQVSELGQLVGLLKEGFTIRDDQVGSELIELKPAAGHAMAGGCDDDQWTGTFKKDDDIWDPQVVSNAIEKVDAEGTIAPELAVGTTTGAGSRSAGALGTSSCLDSALAPSGPVRPPERHGEEDPGMNAGSSKAGGGDAGSGKDKAEAVVEDTPVGEDGESNKSSEDDDKADDDDPDWTAGEGHEKKLEGHEKEPALAPALPYTSAAAFGFTTENTAKFMKLHCLEDVEFFVPVLRLNLEETTEAQFGHIFTQCILECENKYDEEISPETLFYLQECIHNTRKQVKAAFDHRVEVLESIRLTPVNKSDKRAPPQDTSRSVQASMQGTPGSAQASMQNASILYPGLDPQYVLSGTEVNNWMKSLQKKFCLLPAQVAAKRADKLDRKCSSYQCSQRQYSRFEGMLKNIYGGKKNLGKFLATETFTHRMLPLVKPWAEMKPLDKRYANKKSKEAKVKGKRRYYEGLAKDLMDPTNAPKRATRRFGTIMEAMDRARDGQRFFYPYPEETTEASLHGGPAGFVEESSHGDPKGEGKGKGKSKPAWQYIHHNLLSAGLVVANARPPSNSRQGVVRGLHMSPLPHQASEGWHDPNMQGPYGQVGQHR